jgi:hypothetical protein
MNISCETNCEDCASFWGSSCQCVPARYEVSCPNSDEVFYLSEFELKSSDKVCGLCNITYEVSEVK